MTDNATEYIQQLTVSGIEHDVIDLSLDEIFEAFVIGRTQAWPDQATSATALLR